MKKNVLIKGILVLILIASLAIGFTGCTVTFFPTTGTVYINVTGVWWYDLYMDSQKKYSNVTEGTYVLYNVPTGDYFFEAIDTAGWERGYDSVRQYIYAGVINYVYLNP